MPNPSLPQVKSFVADAPQEIRLELESRFAELSRLETEQTQLGTAIPQLYGTLSKFVANPSTVSVETYKRMLDTDETIGSGLDFLNLALIARFGEYKHPVDEIQQFVRRALNQMEGSWHENLDEMISAEWAGFSVTEQVWDYKSDFDGAPAFIPRKLVTYPPLTLVFAVDRNGEVLPDGIYQYQRHHNTTSHLGMGFGGSYGEADGFRPDLFAAVGDFAYPIRIAADLSFMTVRIPRDKVIHLRSSSTGKFNNPYGRSILRRAYKNWVMKDAFLKMWIVAADRKGTPLLVGYAAPNDTVLAQNNNEEMNGAIVQQRADIAMANVFKTIHNSSFVVLPGKKGEMYEVEPVNIQGDMNVFKDGIDYFNRAIMRALLIPPLVMTGGDGVGSYSLGAEHAKIFAKIIDGKLKVYKQGILTQFIRKIIAYNFPKSTWEKHGYGEFTLEEYDPEIMERLANVFQSLTVNGYMSPEASEDLEHVRLKMGLPKGLKLSQYPTTPGTPGPSQHEPDSGETYDIGSDTDGPSEGAPAAGAPAGDDPAVKKADTAMNGAQVSSLVDVVKSVSTGELPKESALQIIMHAFQMERPEAERILAGAGTQTPRPAPTEPQNGGQLPPNYNV
jgi:hypothetical protein